MDATLALTGFLPYIILVAAVLTTVTSAALLFFYRRATLRGMSRSALTGTVSTSGSGSGSASGNPVLQASLRIQEFRERDEIDVSPVSARVLRVAERAQDSTTLIYFLGGLAYSLVMSVTWLFLANDGAPIGRVLWLVILFLWPAVIVCTHNMAIGRLEALLIAGLYLLVLCLVGLFVLVRNSEVSAVELVVNWMTINLPASVLFLAFLHKRVRAVGPLVFAFMLAGVTGALLLVQLIGTSDASLRATASLGTAIGLDATGMIFLLSVIGFVLLAALGWVGLQRLGRAYREGRLGDQSIVVDSAWLVFAVAQSIGLAFDGLYWILSGPLAFAAAKLVTGFGLSRLNARLVDPGACPSLLLLRVFSLGRRSERFFDGFSKLWRRMGDTRMIAGPDLVTTAVEPHEFLDFVGGNLSRRFVKNRDDLQHRIEMLDKRPDPDGRFRVHEFFCHDDT